MSHICGPQPKGRSQTRINAKSHPTHVHGSPSCGVMNDNKTKSLNHFRRPQVSFKSGLSVLESPFSDKKTTRTYAEDRDGCLVSISTAEVHTMTKGNWRKKRSISSYSLQEHFWVKPGQDSGQDGEVGTGEDGMEECCLLACSLWPFQPAFLYHPGTPAQGQ